MILVDYLKILRIHWIIVALFSFCGLGAGGLYFWTQTPVYSADIQLFVSTSHNGVDSDQLNQGASFTMERVKSYVKIVSSPAVTQLVVERLDLGITAGELGSQITASSPVDTVLLDVSVSDTSAVRAQAIANAIGEVFPSVVDGLETPRDATVSPVKISLVKAAELPEYADSPRLALDVMLGLIVGVALGVSTAVARYRMDKRIRDRNEAAEVTGAPVLGSLANDARLRSRLILATGVADSRAEEIRQLRTNIRFLSVDRRLSSFVVTSSVPGEGKTVITANLALAMAQMGERVVLIDGDLRRPKVAETFSLPDGVGLTDVLLGDVTLQDALHQWRDDTSLYILTSGRTPPNPSELLGSHQLIDLIDGLIKSGFTVVFDSPPLLPVTDATLIARATGGALLVTYVGRTRSDQLSSAVESVRSAGAVVLGVVTNRVRHREKAYYYEDDEDRNEERRWGTGSGGKRSAVAGRR